MGKDIDIDTKVLKAIVMTAVYAMTINELLISKGIYSEKEFCEMYDKIYSDGKKPDKQYLFLKVYNKNTDVNKREG